jgi:hypothetical protein
MASIIKADNIQKVSDGTNIIKKCGSTTTIGSGACSPIVICGSTVTLGRCGGTVTLACGATQSGFGQTYSAVEYCTTAKTSPFTAAAGTGYFINTTCGAVTVTLPASPTAGDVVAFKDYAGQWNTNAVTLCNNGNKINGDCVTADLNTQNQSVTLIYVDATKGWQDINDSTAGVTGGAFITATGGTITTSGDYKIHTFTSDGTFCVSAGAGLLAVVDYLVVAGGGAGGSGYRSGGAGAGGFRESHSTPVSGCYTASPLATPTGLPVSAGSYPIIVGGGGTPGTPGCGTGTKGTNGSNSIFSTITSSGGGAGGAAYNPTANPQAVRDGSSGGSGGGGVGHGCGATLGSGGSGNTPPVSPSQGNTGGPGAPYPGVTQQAGGGGGGAGAAGSGHPGGPGYPGGAGVTSSINNTPTTYAGGGGGGGYGGGSGGTGGSGGGGNGGNAGVPCGPGGPVPGVAGTINTGGGGGGAAGEPAAPNFGVGGGGGSGIVIIRYKFQ